MDKSLEDRMESFFLSETLKYLYLVSRIIFNCYISLEKIKNYSKIKIDFRYRKLFK